MMRFFGLISLLTALLFLSSCYPALKGGVRYIDSSSGEIGKVMLYSTLPSVNTFDFVLSHKGRDVSGILIIKVSDSVNRRIVMTSHFGMTLLDFELLEGDNLKVNYSIEQLNSKRILNLLKSDFKTLFNPCSDKSVKFFYGENSRVDALKSGRGIRALVMKFSNFRDGYPSGIVMEHPALKLTLKLDKTNYLDDESL